MNLGAEDDSLVLLGAAHAGMECLSAVHVDVT